MSSLSAAPETKKSHTAPPKHVDSHGNAGKKTVPREKKRTGTLEDAALFVPDVVPKKKKKKHDKENKENHGHQPALILKGQDTHEGSDAELTKGQQQTAVLDSSKRRQSTGDSGLESGPCGDRGAAEVSQPAALAGHSAGTRNDLVLVAASGSGRSNSDDDDVGDDDDWFDDSCYPDEVAAPQGGQQDFGMSLDSSDSQDDDSRQSAGKAKTVKRSRRSSDDSRPPTVRQNVPPPLKSILKKSKGEGKFGLDNEPKQVREEGDEEEEEEIDFVMQETIDKSRYGAV